MRRGISEPLSNFGYNPFLGVLPDRGSFEALVRLRDVFFARLERLQQTTVAPMSTEGAERDMLAKLLGWIDERVSALNELEHGEGK